MLQNTIALVLLMACSSSLLAQGTPAELSDSDDAYVGELLRTPRRQAERLGALLPRDGAA